MSVSEHVQQSPATGSPEWNSAIINNDGCWMAPCILEISNLSEFIPKDVRNLSRLLLWP